MRSPCGAACCRSAASRRRCWRRIAAASRRCSFRRENEKDILEIPANVLKTVELVLVDHMDAVLRRALVLDDPDDCSSAGRRRRPAAGDVPRTRSRPSRLIALTWSTSIEPTALSPSLTDPLRRCYSAEDLCRRKTGGRMTKAELIESVASKVDLPRAIAERAVNTMFDEMTARPESGRQGEHFGIRDVLRIDAQGADRPQSKDGREHRDRCLPRGEVQARQDPQGRSQQRKPLARAPRPSRAVSSAGEHRPYKPGVIRSNRIPPTMPSADRHCTALAASASSNSHHVLGW